MSTRRRPSVGPVLGLMLVTALSACSSSGHRVGDSSKESSTRATTGVNVPATSGGPAIVSFAVTRQPLCAAPATAPEPNGRPGRPVTLAWHVTGAASVVLTVDDPAHAARGTTYNPTSGVTLAFACDPSIQPVNSHLYTLTAGPASKTITVSAKT